MKGMRFMNNKNPKSKIKSLEIPQEILNNIKPETRAEVFQYLIKEYPKRFKQLKLLFAYINTDSESPIDFVVLFKTKSVVGKRNLIVFDIPIIYTDRSLPGYRYCKSNGKEMTDKYYNFAIENMVRLEEDKFKEFVINVAGLSFDPLSSNYWKKPAHAKNLASKLFELSLLYNRPDK